MHRSLSALSYSCVSCSLTFRFKSSVVTFVKREPQLPAVRTDAGAHVQIGVAEATRSLESETAMGTRALPSSAMSLLHTAVDIDVSSSSGAPPPRTEWYQRGTLVLVEVHVPDVYRMLAAGHSLQVNFDLSNVRLLCAFVFCIIYCLHVRVYACKTRLFVRNILCYSYTVLNLQVYSTSIRV